MADSDDTSETPYWRTTVSRVTDARVHIRGYDLQEIIPALPFPASCFLLIRGRLPSPGESRVLGGVLNAILDYSLYKPGTVAARYTVSANPNMAAGLATSVLAVGKHTLAPEDAGRFIIEAHARLVASRGDKETLAEDLVTEAADRRVRIPGFGHPVFTYVDPRGQVLKMLALEAGLWGERAQLYEEVHRAFTSRPGRAAIPINDVGIMAAVLAEMGFTPEEMSGIAVLSMLPGVIAHVSEELREGQPIRVVPDKIAAYPDDGVRSLADDAKEAGWGDELSL